ncbi:hypothetical protein BGZ63DRAFT_377730 [Mariannaea sp. PMI_226]|nr:hypothetical protein BGZ63DRAFT_377730 [Mariannaea sp. PMI_226]
MELLLQLSPTLRLLPDQPLRPITLPLAQELLLATRLSVAPQPLFTPAMEVAMTPLFPTRSQPMVSPRAMYIPPVPSA